VQVFLQGLIHRKQWSSSCSCLFFIWKLVRCQKSDFQQRISNQARHDVLIVISCGHEIIGKAFFEVACNQPIQDFEDRK